MMLGEIIQMGHKQSLVLVVCLNNATTAVGGFFSQFASFVQILVLGKLYIYIQTFHGINLISFSTSNSPELGPITRLF